VILIAVVGDLHVNSAAALAPPVMHTDDGLTIRQSPHQAWLWENWLSFWATVKATKEKYSAACHVHLNGDLVDIHARSAQLISTNHADIINFALDVLQPARAVADVLFIERGTEAHTGGAGYLEEQLARRLTTTPCPYADTASWWYFAGEAEGLRYTVTHHPGTNSLRPWTAGGGVNRAAEMTEAAYYHDAWRPQLAIFNHVHHNEDSGDTHSVRAIFNRAWTLHNAYDHRSGRGAQANEVGGILVLADAATFRVTKLYYTFPRPDIWRSK